MNTQSIDKMEYVSIEGRDCPLNKDQTEVMYKGEWLTIQQDQEGESYIMAGHRLQSIYLSLPTSQPSVSIDKEKIKMGKDHPIVQKWFDLSESTRNDMTKKHYPERCLLTPTEMVDIFEKEPGLSIDKEVLDSGNWFENEWRKLEQKGYNPAAMEELVKAAVDVLNWHKAHEAISFIETKATKDLETALNNSKL